MIVENKFGKEVNVLHFCGGSFDYFPKTISNIYQNCILSPLDKDITLVSCWTEQNKCILYGQLFKNSIQLNNCIPNEYNYTKDWYMPYKICYILQYLINCVKTEYVMILDGYDSLFSSTKNILEKFHSQKYRILFNATCNNYPKMDLDIIPDRDSLGLYKYFNAGCCIGYKEDLIKFYSLSLKYINYDNPLNSEQYLLRLVFSEFSNNPEQNFVGIDYNNLIFNSMGKTKVEYDSEKDILRISENLEDEDSTISGIVQSVS